MGGSTASMALAHDVKEKTGFGNAKAVCNSRDKAKGVKVTKALQWIPRGYFSSNALMRCLTMVAHIPILQVYVSMVISLNDRGRS